MGNVVRISGRVIHVGVKDWSLRLFDGLIPLPHGTSYNAYLVLGESALALIDTVSYGFEGELIANLSEVIDPPSLNFVIMNHAEPDHAGAIPHVMSVAKGAKLVLTAKGADMAAAYYRVPKERMHVVEDGDELDLGGLRLRFIEAPFLHWPETMFTYLVEDGILFPCDFFGAHIAHGMFADEVSDVLVHAQRYFGAIMMPFKKMAQRALEKLGGLEVQMIAPSHGPVYRNPKPILDAYSRWVSEQTSEKAAIVYVSMWGSVEKLVRVVERVLVAEGIEVVVHNLAVADVGDIAKDLVDARALVIGAPTVLGSIHPLGLFAAHIIRALRPSARYAFILSSHGWSSSAVKALRELLSQMELEIIGVIDSRCMPTDGDLERAVQLARLLVQRIKGTAIAREV